jgi:hypothetical protein
MVDNMRFSLAGFGFLIITGISAAAVLPAKESEHRQPIAWCYVQDGPLELVRKGMGRRTSSLTLGRGALVPVLRTESKNGRVQAMLRITDLAALTAVDGWADSSKAEILPIDRFPSDAEVLRQLNIEPPAGFAAPSVAVARWLVKQGDSGMALVCFVALFGLPDSRLVAFLPLGGKYVRGPWLEFPFFDLKPGILSGEVRDLLGDGVECLITHEPFRQGPATLGVNIVIRRLEHGSFSSLWRAPLESQNLGFFPRQAQILQPLEKNVGAPGTVTKGEVEFEPRGKIQIPVWKATVEFFAVGQDKPLDSVKVTKACAWNGSEFEPVR